MTFTAVRIRLEPDHNPDLSHLQQTPEEYAEMGPIMEPRCEHCRLKLTTRTTTGRRSPSHYFWVHEASGRIRCPGTGTSRYLMATPHPLTWKEYQHTYGNPENYYTVGAIVQTRCDCCGLWSDQESVWGFDFYIDDAWPDAPSTYGEVDSKHPLSDLPEFITETFDLDQVLTDANTEEAP